jgi:hypothetical protein
MLNVQSYWGENLGADLCRLASGLQFYGKLGPNKDNSTTLFVPAHEVFNPSGKLKFDSLGNPTDPINKDRCLSSPSETDLVSLMVRLKPFLSSILPKLDNKNQPESSELVIYIDDVLGGFGHRTDIDNVPPPLAYYRYVIESRYWEKVTVAIPSSTSNLFVRHLKHFYPKINIHAGSAPARWQYLLNARNLVIGADLFGQASALLSDSLERLWLPDYSIISGRVLAAYKAKVYPIKIVDYIDRDSWFGGVEQMATICNHPESKILDETKWIFTESEKCRSFEYCHSCRDTTVVGKLWRSVIAERFEVPKRDWECPHGWKWGGVPGWLLRLKRAFGIGTIIKRTASVLGVKPCSECLDREARYDGKRA